MAKWLTRTCKVEALCTELVSVSTVVHNPARLTNLSRSEVSEISAAKVFLVTGPHWGLDSYADRSRSAFMYLRCLEWCVGEV